MRKQRQNPVRKLTLLILIVAGFFLANVSLQAEGQWSTGQTFDAIRYEDQHGKLRILDASVQYVIFLADMDAKDSLHQFLQDAGQPWLDDHKAVVVADIHEMPYLVSVMFALPAMRDYSYALHLIRESGPGERFPAKAGQLTLIRLENRKVMSIEIFETGKALMEAIESR